MSKDDERGFFAEVPLLPAKPEQEAGQKLPLSPKKKHYEGHRQRLRNRFTDSGSDTLSDYEILEMMLFRTIPRADTKALAKSLLATFGTIAEVLGSPTQRLREVPGIGDAVAQDIKLIAVLSQRMLRSKVQGKQVLSSWTQVLEYCHSVMAFEEREQFRILFLDKKNCLIRDEVQQVGTVDHTPVYPREVMRRALELSASALILVHNHPSGDPTPSRADIDMTKLIVLTGQPLGIAIHDHIIIGKNGHASVKGLRLI